jgi:hypothetical protein
MVCSVAQWGAALLRRVQWGSYGSTMCVHIRKKVVIRDVAVVTSTQYCIHQYKVSLATKSIYKFRRVWRSSGWYSVAQNDQLGAVYLSRMLCSSDRVHINSLGCSVLRRIKLSLVGCILAQ